MFFRNAKKKWIKRSNTLITRLKVLLFNILRNELKVLLLTQVDVSHENSMEYAGRYAAFVVNRLFGDDNSKTLTEFGEIILMLDSKHSSTAGKIISQKYPELVPLITDAVLRYYQVASRSNTGLKLKPKNEVFNDATKMKLMLTDKNKYKTFSDSEFIKVLDQVESKYESNLISLDRIFIESQKKVQIEDDKEVLNNGDSTELFSNEEYKKEIRCTSTNDNDWVDFDEEFMKFIAADHGLSSNGLVYCPELSWFEEYLYTFGDDYKQNISTLKKVLFDFMELEEVKNYVKSVHELDFQNVSKIEKTNHFKYTQYRVMLNILNSNCISEEIRSSHKMRYFQFMNSLKLEALNIFQMNRISNVKRSKQLLEGYIIDNSVRINSHYEPYDLYLQFQVYFDSLGINPIEIEEWLLDDEIEEEPPYSHHTPMPSKVKRT